MKSDLVEHPCPVCKRPSRSCGHTKADLRAYYDHCRELRRAAKAALPPAEMVRHHPVPAQGAEVFASREDDARQVVLVPVSGKLLKCRMTSPVNPVRELTDAEYGGQPTLPDNSRNSNG
jgi:hypothetical protein